MGRRRSPAAVSGGSCDGEAADGRRRATVVLVASSVAANSFRNGGYGWMKLSNSGEQLPVNRWSTEGENG
jgi:hypothetical protein